MIDIDTFIAKKPEPKVLLLQNPLTFYNPDHVAAVSILAFENSELEESIRELGFLSGQS